MNAATLGLRISRPVPVDDIVVLDTFAALDCDVFPLDGDAMSVAPVVATNGHGNPDWIPPREEYVVLYSHGVPIAYRAWSGHGGVTIDERPGGRRLGRIMAHARRATAAAQEAGCPVETVDHEAFVARCEQIGAGGRTL